MQELMSVEEEFADNELIEPSAIDQLFAEPGLIGDHAPFILKYVRGFHLRYSWLGFDELVREAMRLGREAEKHFKPELGFKFATLLRWYLKGLHRYASRHIDFIHPRRRIPGAVHRVSPNVIGLLVLNRADPGFVQQVIKYKQRKKNPPGGCLGRLDDLGVLHQVATARAVRYEQLLLAAAAAERPHLSKNEANVLNWIVGQLVGTDNRILTQVARDFGLTKGAVSKIRARIMVRLELWCDKRSRSAKILKGGNARASACHIEI